MTSLVLRKVRGNLSPILVVPKVIGGGVLKLERVQTICPACGQQVEAVAWDGRVKGYCAVTKQYVDFLIEPQLERKKYQQTPEHRAKASATMKELWQKPEYRAKMSAIRKKAWQDPEYRAKMDAALKKTWQDPEYQAKVSAIRKKYQQTPEYRAKMSAVLKKTWQDPEYRAKQSATHAGKHVTADGGAQ